jgi:predicted transposase YdaD
MIWRMLEYYMLIYQNYQQYPFQRFDRLSAPQVLYVGQAPLNMIAQLKQDVLYYHYQLLDIREIDCRFLLESPSIADNVLAILCRLGENQNQVVKEILSRVARLEGKRRQDALEHLRIIAGLRSPKLQQLVKQESIKMPITVDMSQTIWGIELFEQGKSEGEQKGRLVGKTEGEREGKLKGEAAMLQRLLERRFGPLPAWAVERIQQANCEQLEIWSLRVLEVHDLESIFV